MLAKFLEKLKQEGPFLPNAYTVVVGERIRRARTEAKMSQAELADKVYLRQSSVSKVEAGTRAISGEEILYLSYALDKPVSYFFPEQFVHTDSKDRLSLLEHELLDEARRLTKEDLRRLIAQARALADLGPSPDQYAGKDPQAVVESLFGKAARASTKKAPKRRPAKR